MKKRLLVLFVIACCYATNVGATVYTEDFEAPFPQWQSDWLGLNSNVQNYYVDYYPNEFDSTSRGNNPDGLWISDKDTSTSDAVIKFNPVFGSTLTSFSIDLAAHTSEATLTIYDMSDSVILSTQITRTDGATVDPGIYTHYSVTSDNGISGFTITGVAVSIDNVVVISRDQNPRSITVDIKPNDRINSINPDSKGVIPVAVFTNDSFGAATLDPNSFYFGPNETPPVHYSFRDINKDGKVDLLLHFRIRDTGIECGDTSATLLGQSTDGLSLEGSDSIRTVGCRPRIAPFFWFRHK